MILLSFITFGIYDIYWYCAFQNELKEKTGEGYYSLGHILATIFSFGIYGVYWQYAAGKRLNKLGAVDLSFVYLLLSVIGAGFINPFIMQHQANNL